MGDSVKTKKQRYAILEFMDTDHPSANVIWLEDRISFSLTIFYIRVKDFKIESHWYYYAT